ncbi:uncharacterized protein LOC128554739 [Mercenaria mercenaria]|uniref:uncharacterized protein LOC128554739 n=1 Tax=Mercenaria mercenaria TaxID=6596 RepID=UPI00234F9018|nr:uncharacterized protein LOC128554739 [Mercenaria mercenaria]
MDGQSNISEGRDECMEGFKPFIGTDVQKSTKASVFRSSVGPIVTLDGCDEKCFITTGNGQIDNNCSFVVNGRYEALKILAIIFNGMFILIAPVGYNLPMGNYKRVPQKEEVIDDKDETASGKMVLQDLQNALVFKVGAGTGLTYGYMERDALGSKEQGLKGYMLVRSLGEKPFAAPGDGGALVFHRRAKDWSCIGVLIGRSSTGTYVVKTIKEILEGFEQYIGRSIALDTPFMDPQVSAILDNEK